MATRRVERSRVRAKTAVAELPRGTRLDLRRFAPSGPSLVAGFALLALGIGAYGIARETPLFAIDRIEVLGASPAVRAEVAAALEPLQGRSLVGLRASDLDRRIATLPEVVGVTHDRAFPHTLRVFVRAERPLVVLRKGPDSWLVSARGRVVRPVGRGARPALARVWIPRRVDVAVGDTLADAGAARAVSVIALATPRLPAPIRTVKLEGAETTIVLRSGLELRLGRPQELPLKLEVAASILPAVDPGTTYLDVAVPDRPVAGTATQAQPELEGATP